ncbi:hypothetical protein AC781_11460 [Akkermansia glycaniphila]|nr:hypothetical protein AC781_11460 [Akkermansia glycaniphila]
MRQHPPPLPRRSDGRRLRRTAKRQWQRASRQAQSLPRRAAARSSTPQEPEPHPAQPGGGAPPPSRKSRGG